MYLSCLPRKSVTKYYVIHQKLPKKDQVFHIYVSHTISMIHSLFYSNFTFTKNHLLRDRRKINKHPFFKYCYLIMVLRILVICRMIGQTKMLFCLSTCDTVYMSTHTETHTNKKIMYIFIIDLLDIRINFYFLTHLPCHWAVYTSRLF